MHCIYDLTRQELQDFLVSKGEKPFRARQVISWVYGKRISDFEAMTNISESLRKELTTYFSDIGMHAIDACASKDGTTKILVGLSDGEKIESVLIPDGDRQTLCVSTQVGCAVGCVFCVTSRIGFRRNLKVSEIIGQFLIADRWSRENGGKRITNIVLMGMGEAMLNYDNVLKALRIFTDAEMLSFSRKRVTVSSAGILKGLEKLARTEFLGCLTVSLGGSTQEQRQTLIPAARENTLEALVSFLKAAELPGKNMFTIAYVLIKGFNDSEEDAQRLASLFKGIPCKFNLIPYNENKLTDFRTPEQAGAERFGKVLLDRGYMVMLRKSRGAEINAACGMLRAGYETRDQE